MFIWKDSRLSIRITRLGAMYVAAAAAVGLLGVYTGSNMLHAVLGLMIGMLLVSGWVSRASLLSARPGGIEAGALFARLRGGVRLRMAEGAPGRTGGLEVSLDIEGCRVGHGFFRGGRSPVALGVRPEKRGALRVRGAVLRTGYPFGLLEKAVRFPMDAVLVVAPHPAGAEEPDRGGDDYREPTPASGYSSPVGARPFLPGDPMGRMHWKRTAQRGEPMVRLMEGDEAKGLALELDLCGWRPGPAFEGELERLSGAILQARLQRRDAALVVYGPGGARADAAGHMEAWRALAGAEALPGRPEGGPP